ncbi:immunoglobulin superfamily member 10 [Gadus macrocephalus]|uniref:immunoglobulin superfamily member 10 n=1 Tax=Gadus macrocephalus TaxID=80720 RepID=UPI0028CB8297|nr:immunoglobulin superfamily member 10 [Gadus macrocephalus]
MRWAQCEIPALSRVNMSALGGSYARRWLLLSVFVLALMLPASSGCPKSCACYVPGEVHCTFRYLTAIPEQIQASVERINMGYNRITVLREGDFTGLLNLELLMLHSNTIHLIENGAFLDLKSLQVLKMSYNKVKELKKETFKGLDSLLRLHMDHNSIEFISPDAFFGLTSLQLVHLEGNLLHQLHPDTFVTLRLSGAFKVSSVRNIHLSDNHLTGLPADIFSGCSRLENLFLHGNPWSCDCRMEWLPKWSQRNPGVLKCKRDKKYAQGQLCPMCASPGPHPGRSLSQLPSESFTCNQPWIHPHLKQSNVSLATGDFTPVLPRDFLAPIGSMQLNLTDHFFNVAVLSCTVQRPSSMENLTLTEEDDDVSLLRVDVASSLVCNVDYEHVQQLWHILATYSDSPMRLERGLMLSRSPEMLYQYRQLRPEEGREGIYTDIKAVITASPGWLMQEMVHLQLDRTTTTYSTLHIRYWSVVHLRVESRVPKKDRYSWTLIKRDNKTRTEHTVLKGGVAELNCQTMGEPKPSVEWILADGNKVRAPFFSEEGKIVITADGRLTLRGADISDAGLYRCIATNYLDADILNFRITVLPTDVEEAEVNGVQLSRAPGQDLVLDCGSTGSPEASVQWILPDHSVVRESYGNKKLHENGTLRIRGLTARDRGFYRCLAANYMGADLLVSLVTLTAEAAGAVAEDEEPTLGVDVMVESDTGEKEMDLSVPPPLSERTSQESRTITSDRPYPRLGSLGRGRMGLRRNGAMGNRRIWSNRIFNANSRRVAPEKFAEFMKKAQGASKQSDTGLSGNGETGSGEGFNEVILPDSVTYSTDSPQLDSTLLTARQQEYSTYPDTVIKTQNSEYNGLASAQTDGMKTTESYTQSHLVTPMDSAFTDSPERLNELQSDAATPQDTVLEKSVTAGNWIIPREFYTDGSTKINQDPSVFHSDSAVADNSEETELTFSGENPAEPETSTRRGLSFVTEPNVTPMTDGAGPANPVVHTSTDAESQTTFTAVTITERGQDEVTFHTTQKITSPGLPAGSTIISHQQIHIIPPPKTGRGGGRGGGRRRPFQGRRRIIKPNRITDIQSYINKLTLPTIKKERNVTVGYTVQLVTDLSRDAKEKTTTTEIPNVAISPISMGSHWSKSDIPLSARHTTATTKYHTTKALLSNSQSGPGYSRDYITSADAPERTFTPDPLMSTSEEAITSTTPMPTKAVQKRFQWHRQFGHKGKYRQRLNRFQRPSIKTQTTTTVKTTTMIPTTTPASPATTMYLIHSRYTTSKESSSDNGYQDVSSADYEPTTASPISHYQTSTIPSFNTITNTQTSPPIQTIDSPPTVSPPSRANPDESSGSGGYPEDWRVIKQKPKGAGGRIGRRRKPINGRRPFRKPTTTTAAPTTTQATTNLKPTIYTTMRTLMKTTVLPFSVSTPLYTPSREYDGSTGMASSEEQTNVYGEDKWHDSTYTTPQTKTMTKGPWATIPKPSSTVITIRTTNNPETTFRTTVYSNIKPAKGNRYQPTGMPIRPTMRSNSGIPVDFDTFAITTPEQEYPTTATTVVVDLTTAKNMQSKPKILGGNAASFTVLSNSDAFLPCEAVGDPEPAIRWMRFSTSTGHTITIKGKMGKFEVLSNGTLAIQNANIKDRGQYLCLAENDLGSDKLLITLSVVAYPSRILEPKIREIKFHAGSTVEMKCKAEGRPTPLISWILANRTQVRGYISGKGRASVTPEGTLIIEQVSVYDRGHYKCIASNPAGAATATVRLQVVSAPPGILQEKRENVKAVMGQSLWLPCTGQGNPPPTLHWVQPDGSAVQTNKPAPDPRVAMYDNGTLHFKDLALTDNGKYECIATSSTGSERRVVTVTVEKRDSAPRIVETSQLMTEMSFGDQLRLNCMATGEPKPRIMWRLPSKAVVDQWHRMGSRIHVEENGTLIVNMVNDKDAGDYLCVARSKMGDEFRLMKVTVSMQPAKIEPKHYGKKQVPFGRDLKVDCKASGSPQPDISWGLPDGTLVNSAMQSDSSSGNNGGRRTRRYVLFDNGTLYLNQVGISEEGDYTCYAENQVGKDEMHVHITVVTAAPRIRPPRLTYGKVKPGGDVRFDCEAVGEPKPKILWMLPNNDVIAASHERYLMHVNGSLDIRDVKMMDVGQYVCMARNPAGENRKVYRLELDGNPPVINGYRQNRTVIKDAAVKYSRKFIDCKAEGTPSPSITWIMPDNIFLKAPYFGSRINVHHNGTLEFRNVRPTDTAEYICMARNGEGEAVMVVQLEVTSMLRRPIFRNPFNERVVARLGKTAVLNCSADGYPTPDMIWILPNGTRITAGPERGYRHHLGSDGTFMIYNSVKEDSGKYRCAAKNTVGYIEKLILLEVGQKPYILSRPRGIIRAVSGEPLFVHCLVDGSPRPSVSWTVPGGHTLTGTQALGRYRLLENGTLVVRDTTIYDRGTYVCRAQNDAGEAVLKVPVIIIAYTPRITTWPPPNVRAMVGAPVQLSCGAIGIPKPEINWELPDGSVLSAAGPGRPKGSELLHPQGTLIIQRPMVSDSGAYKCIAKNQLGTDTKLTYVRVL